MTYTSIRNGRAAPRNHRILRHAREDAIKDAHPFREASMADKNPPTYTAYATKREGQRALWLEIGVASAHSDGKGFDVLLDRLPVGGFNGHVLVRANGTKPEGL